MTGYGRGEAAQDGCKVTVELSSVNRKQGEVQVSLPRELESLEARVRDAINQGVARGRVTARVTQQAGDGEEVEPAALNVPLARAYAAELRRLADAVGLVGGVTIEALLRIPGVVSASAPAGDPARLWPLIESALRTALAQLVAARVREGAHLARDLRARVATMRRLTARIRRRAPQVARDFRKNLLARIQSLGLEEVSARDERVVKEVVFFADRADISEELTRLESHYQQFDTGAASGEAVGRMLDFLAQEMGREINTIGSKANDGAISRAVVNLKAELEKFREQAQNVE